MAYAPILEGEEAKGERLLQRPPFLKCWCAVPVLSGLVPVLVGCSEELMSTTFATEMAERPAFRAVLISLGLMVMTAVLPTYYIVETAESAALDDMLRKVVAARPEFKDEFTQKMGSILLHGILQSLATMLMGAVLAWFAFRTLACAAVGAVVFGPSSLMTACQTHFVELLVQVCGKDIDVFIEEALPDNGAKVDWANAARQHLQLDLRQEQLWAPSTGVMVIGPLIARQFSLGCTFLVLGVVLDEPYPKGAAWLLGSWFVLRGVLVLRGPADITARCCDSSPHRGRQAIKAAVNLLMSKRQMSEEEEVAFVRFVQYLHGTTTGIELMGVLVTSSLIFGLSTKMVTSLPIAVGLLENLMDKSMSELNI